jgi:hypothetical protein
MAIDLEGVAAVLPRAPDKAHNWLLLTIATGDRGGA